MFIMTKEREEELRQSLMEKDKEHVVELFIRLKKMFERQGDLLEKAEEELIEKMDLDEIIEEIPDKFEKK